MSDLSGMQATGHRVSEADDPVAGALAAVEAAGGPEALATVFASAALALMAGWILFATLRRITQRRDMLDTADWTAPPVETEAGRLRRDAGLRKIEARMAARRATRNGLRR